MKYRYFSNLIECLLPGPDSSFSFKKDFLLPPLVFSLHLLHPVQLLRLVHRVRMPYLVSGSSYGFCPCINNNKYLVLFFF